MALGDGMIPSWALQVASTLRLADLLAAGPLSPDDLAGRTETHPDALGRFLRYLASLGVVSEMPDGRFDLTQAGSLLRSDVEGSLRQWFVMNGVIWRTFADAPLESLRTGQPAFNTVFGASVFEHAERDQEWGAAFDEAMVGATHTTARAVLDAYDLADARLVVDVGGGRGHLVRAILDRHPAARGIVFDLPQVAARARLEIEQAGLADRLQVVGGSFFETVPPGGDAYLLSWILHDWDDDRALVILRACRGAIGPGGRLLVIEACIPSGDVPHPGKPLDMVMLVAMGGRERTEVEYRELLAAAGFRLTRVVATASPMSVLEAIPV